MTNQMNYVTANRFYVEIESTIRASFNECSGLGVTIETEKYPEGGVNDQQRILLKQAKFSDVSLKRGITDDLAFWKWVSQVLSGVPKQRVNVNIILFNQAGERMQTWTLIGAVPVGWKAPSLQASANSVAIEELTLAYEALRIEGGSGGDLVGGKGQIRSTKGFFGSN